MDFDIHVPNALTSLLYCNLKDKSTDLDIEDSLTTDDFLPDNKNQNNNKPHILSFVSVKIKRIIVKKIKILVLQEKLCILG